MALNEPERAASAVIRSWSDALDRHDADKLGELYASSVRFYGRPFAKNAVVAAKRAALAKRPPFHQQLIGQPEFSRVDDQTLSATLTKRSGYGDHFEVVTAQLVLSRADAGRFLIVEESDQPTAAREAALEREREARAANDSRCVEAASEAVEALPEVKRQSDEAMAIAEKSGGKAHFGGIGPAVYDGVVIGSLGFHTDERFEERIGYTVSNGVLAVSVAGAEVKVPEETLRKVKAACRAEPVGRVP